MIRKKQSSFNEFDQKHFIRVTKRRFRKKFGRKITATEINKIWKDFVQYRIINGVVKGDKVKIDKHSTIQVIGTMVYDNQKMSQMLAKGKMLSGRGEVINADLGRKKKDVVYKIVYKNTLAKENIYFKACPEFRRQVKNAIENTNTYYHIKPITNL